MDWNAINTLLDVLEGSRLYPQLKPLHDAAMAELLAAVDYVKAPQGLKTSQSVGQVQGSDNGDGNRRI